jgi:antitoxin MazE
MKTKLVRIGNSRGIRLPKPLIEEAGLLDEVELEVRKGAIVISPANGVRSGWEEAAEAIHGDADDQLLDAGVNTRFDDEEWKW